MKRKTFLFLLFLRGFNLNLYIKIRSLLQLNYIFPKNNRFSNFLLNILQKNNKNEINIRKIAADRLLVLDYVKENCSDVFLP